MMLMKAEYDRREEKYMEIVRMLQDDYDKFKNEVQTELDLKELIITRKDQYNATLKKELIYA